MFAADALSRWPLPDTYDEFRSEVDVHVMGVAACLPASRSHSCCAAGMWGVYTLNKVPGWWRMAAIPERNIITHLHMVPVQRSYYYRRWPFILTYSDWIITPTYFVTQRYFGEARSCTRAMVVSPERCRGLTNLFSSQTVHMWNMYLSNTRLRRSCQCCHPTHHCIHGRRSLWTILNSEASIIWLLWIITRDF